MKEYHTHTFRCHHAIGDVSDYAKSACEKGYKILGITDHTPLPNRHEIRMDISELDSYIKAIETAQKAYPEIKIIKGMECEYLDQYHSFYQDVLLGEMSLRYLILGQHIFWLNGEWIDFWKGTMEAKGLRAYTNSLIKGIGSGLFSLIAHPDIFGAVYIPWDTESIACSRAILDAAKDMDLPVELNTHGMRKDKISAPEGIRNQYPLEPFWELVSEYELPVVISADAHAPEDIGINTEEALDFAHKLSLKLTDLPSLES